MLKKPPKNIFFSELLRFLLTIKGIAMKYLLDIFLQSFRHIDILLKFSSQTNFTCT
jgi:hypothetical protein